MKLENLSSLAGGGEDAICGDARGDPSSSDAKESDSTRRGRETETTPGVVGVTYTQVGGRPLHAPCCWWWMLLDTNTGCGGLKVRSDIARGLPACRTATTISSWRRGGGVARMTAAGISYLPAGHRRRRDLWCVYGRCCLGVVKRHQQPVCCCIDVALSYGSASNVQEENGTPCWPACRGRW